MQWEVNLHIRSYSHLNQHNLNTVEEIGKIQPKNIAAKNNLTGRVKRWKIHFNIGPISGRQTWKWWEEASQQAPTCQARGQRATGPRSAGKLHFVAPNSRSFCSKHIHGQRLEGTTIGYLCTCPLSVLFIVVRLFCMGKTRVTINKKPNLSNSQDERHFNW